MIEALDAITVRFGGKALSLEPGQTLELPEDKAKLLLELAPGKVRYVSPIRPGQWITWTRGDGTTQTGLVDVLHVDEAGTRWAFVTLRESWAAVNMKFVTRSGDA